MITVGRQLAYARVRHRDGHWIFDIISTMAQAIREWTPSTRISPVAGIREFGTERTSPDFQTGDHTVVSFGPCHPDLLRTLLPALSRPFLSLGLLNVLVVLPDEADPTAFVKALADKGYCYELWGIQSGVITVLDHSGNEARPASSSLSTLCALLDLKLPPELQPVIAEFCPLAASAASRANQHLPPAHEDLLADIDAVRDILSYCEQHADTQASMLETFGVLAAINAALSRFASQTFAATPPLLTTESRIWNHSLFGIGVASLALRSIRDFVEQAVGVGRIADYVAGYVKVPPTTPHPRQLPSSDKFWRTDHLSRSSPEGHSEPRSPMITYFSGREGFSQRAFTLSAAVPSIAACNSRQWTLLTITHEISHMIIEPILDILLPDFGDATDHPLGLTLARAISLARTDDEGANLYEQMVKLLMVGFVEMEAAWRSPPGRQYEPNSEEEFTDILVRWHDDVEETMVHTFDLFYFYSGQVKKYVQSIWVSWGTIPNVMQRVPEYVERTISAVAATFDSGDAVELAKDDVLSHLRALEPEGFDGPYVQYAISFIQDRWKGDLEWSVRARYDVAILVKAFLYSSEWAAIISGDRQATSDERRSYPIKEGEFETFTIRNPLHFADAYARSKRPSEIDSFWLLCTLAFNVQVTKPK